MTDELVCPTPYCAHTAFNSRYFVRAAALCYVLCIKLEDMTALPEVNLKYLDNPLVAECSMGHIPLPLHDSRRDKNIFFPKRFSAIFGSSYQSGIFKLIASSSVMDKYTGNFIVSWWFDYLMIKGVHDILKLGLPPFPLLPLGLQYTPTANVPRNKNMFPFYTQFWKIQTLGNKSCHAFTEINN